MLLHIQSRRRHSAWGLWHIAFIVAFLTIFVALHLSTASRCNMCFPNLWDMFAVTFAQSLKLSNIRGEVFLYACGSHKSVLSVICCKLLNLNSDKSPISAEVETGESFFVQSGRLGKCVWEPVFLKIYYYLLVLVLINFP